MRKLLTAAAMIVVAGSMTPSGAQTGGGLDAATVTAVRVTGPAGVIRLNASRTGPYRAELRSRPDSWLAFWRSNWTSGGCEAIGSIRLDGTLLLVDTGGRSWLARSDCRLELDATLPEGIAVSIEQDAASGSLEGRFGSLRVDSRAGDIALDGYARTVSIEGNAIRARLDYASVEANETIALDGNAIDADLSFSGAKAVSYQVSGHASLVDSTLPNIPGAKPAITVKGDFLRVHIGR